MKFLAEADSLTITFQGIEILGAAKRKLVLPKDKIVNLEWTPEYDFHDFMLKIIGSGVPRMLYAGSFRDTDRGETVFLYLRLPKGLPINRTLSDANVLAVTMQDYPYAKVFVTCPPDIGASLLNWFKLASS